MPYSTRLRDTTIPQRVARLVGKLWRKLTILDIWAWAWKWADLLKPYYDKIDAVEIRTPYIEQFELKKKYRHVINSDVMDLDFVSVNYDLVILWDIFEHLSVENAKTLLHNLRFFKVFVMIPFNTPQWEHYWNIYETHLQPDLDEKKMRELYPQLTLWFKSWRFGFYFMN